MPLDTTDFDSKINDITNQISVAQATLNGDPLAQQLTTYNQKASVLAELQNQLAIVKASKDQAIVIQTQIDVENQQITDLKNTLK